MENTQLIERFYSSFAQGNVEGMLSCYHAEVIFRDPAFGELKGERAFGMWKMLLANRTAATRISFDGIEVFGNKGKANWQAEYLFGSKKRKVVNKIYAEFIIENGKIIRHTDSFDLWKWSRQAIGAPGIFLGWSGFMRNQIQKMANKNLDRFLENS